MASSPSNFFGFCMAMCLSVGDIPSGSELFFHPFPLIRAIRAAQILVLEFSKDGTSVLGDEFAGGVANQPEILQIGVGLSCCQVSQRYCQFQSNF